MEVKSQNFLNASQEAMQDGHLQSTMKALSVVMPQVRSAAVSSTENFEDLREYVVAVKNHTLEYLDEYLDQYENQVRATGGQVHHAATADDLNRIVIDICRQAEARNVVKGKSMIGEETGLNEAMEQAEFNLCETDMGEYIIQLAHEPPSHILAPAIHKTQDQVRELFLGSHDLGERPLDSVQGIVSEARSMLRDRFLEADVGITGANCVIAETGTSMLVTNEGNGDLSSSLPKVHIVITGIEKLVPSLEDATALNRMLVRSATGQKTACYTSFHTGPRRQDDPDGPEEYHVVLLDNGRRSLLGGKYQDMLRCIRCGACMNHCPIYRHVGGHSYGWVYPGPMGSVLTPLLTQLDKAKDLPNACTACGRCEEVCPMKIPLPDLLRNLRDDLREQRIAPASWRYAIAGLTRLFRSPRLYHWSTVLAAPILKLISRQQWLLQSLPLLKGWARGRTLPTPPGKTFLQQQAGDDESIQSRGRHSD